MKRILLALFIISMAASVFAETRPFEVSKNSYDPYIAESRGFESLFVNPAGMAGQTDILTWDIEAGTQGKRSTYETIQFLMENSDALSGGSEDMTAEDSEELVELLVDNLDQGSIDKLTGKDLTNSISIPQLDGKTADEIIAFFAGGGTLTPQEIQDIETNITNNQEQILEEALGNLEVVVEFTTKIGTLINGFGLGVYGNAYSVLDAGEMGFESLIIETGIKGGYGFNMGDFSFGVSGDVAMVGDVTANGGVSVTDFGAIANQMMVYGYAWGLDAGVQYDVNSWITVGAVMTDIIGSYSPAGEATVEDFYTGSGASTSIPFEYSFDTDIDMGITISPQLGKLLRPSFSLDYYNFIDIFRDTPEDFQGFLDNMRLGASLELLTFINLRGQYYQEFFTVGAGVDLLFVEVFGEFMFKQTFDDIGGAILVKLHI